jgi:putative membrane protein
MRFGPYYDHGAGWWVGGLFGLLVVVAIVVGAILIVRQVLDRPQHTALPPAPPAMTSRAVEELDLRYARGEIDRTEYLQRRADLLHAPGSWSPGPPPAAPAPPQPPGAAPPPST